MSSGVQMGDTLTSRSALRSAVANDILGRAEIAGQTLEGGPLDGIVVVSIDTLRKVVEEHLAVALPPPSDQFAEVVTPATVTVAARCPECKEPSTIGVNLDARLTVEGNTTELSVKASSKARAHMHGQQPLPVAEADGQTTVEGAIDDLRTRILGAVADVSDAHGADDPEQQGPPPTLEAIAERLGLATENDRADLEDSLYAYAEGDDALVEIVRVKKQATTYVLTDKGIAFLADRDALEDAPDDTDAEGEA